MLLLFKQILRAGFSDNKNNKLTPFTRPEITADSLTTLISDTLPRP
jgi:hypothetical protein